MINYETLKKCLFKLEPETAHSVAELFLRGVKYCPIVSNYLIEKNFIDDEILHNRVDEIDYLNPVGLGAGFDKNATMLQGLLTLGFGFVEVGTFTPKPQPGNKKPRLFRFVEDNSLQNAMGFNNDGMNKIEYRVRKNYPFAIPIGINIGKNKTTPLDSAIKDYETIVKNFKDIGDFFIINISSPNTPGLRDLQNEEFVKELLKKLRELTNKVIYIKIAPDMSIDSANLLIQTAIDNKANGIIANNTSNDYTLLNTHIDFGGISGEAIKEKSFEFFNEIAKTFYKKTTLISIGGIDNASEAYRRIKAGASLVEVYTALIFKGPSLVRSINNGLIGLLKRDGFKNIKEAIGVDR